MKAGTNVGFYRSALKLAWTSGQIKHGSCSFAVSGLLVGVQTSTQ